jgi:hypothetical protein
MDAGAVAIPVVKTFDLKQLAGSCRRLYACYHHQMVLWPDKGHSIISHLVVLTSMSRDRNRENDALCRRKLAAIQARARSKPHRFPLSCGGRVDVKKQSSLLRNQTDQELCGRVILCCGALNRLNKTPGKCRAEQRSIGEMGVAYCPYIWARFEKVLSLWARKGQPRPPECSVPK